MQKYKYTVDSTFQIGSYHVNGVSPCQDYADTLVSEHGERATLVISDGCSSGGKTDVGARILTHKYLVSSKRNNHDHGAKVNLTKRDLEYLGLAIEDFLATLVTVEADQDQIRATVSGDGVVVFQMENGFRYIYQIEWANNAPAYPVYFSDAGKEAGLSVRFKEFHMDSSEPMSNKSFTVEHFRLIEEIKTRALDEEVQIAPTETISMSTDEPVVMVAIFSDGIDQIRHTVTGERIPLLEAIQLCLSFKNTNGSFVKRRIRKQITDWKKDGYEPFDDLSCAVLLLEELGDDDEVAEAIISSDEEVNDGN